MKVALYARVSTADQDTEIQLVQLREWASRGNHEVFKEYVDEAISGTKTSRPSFDEMLKDMRQFRFQAVAVVKLDRIGRSLQHILSLFDEFNAKGVAFIATTQGIDTFQSNPMSKLFISLLGAFAEFERNLISERTKAARAGKPNWGVRGVDKRPRKKRGGFRKPILYPTNTPLLENSGNEGRLFKLICHCRGLDRVPDVDNRKCLNCGKQILLEESKSAPL
jgi:DNA invertase Pin-like site-specific DNA recombinase